MKIVVLQPLYLPWVGYFDQIHQSDVFVFYDDVQYSKQSWQSRNKIKSQTGWQWLIVSILKKSQDERLICNMEIDNHRSWFKKHLQSIKLNYRKSPYYDDYIGHFELIYSKEWRYLVELDIKCIKLICELLGLKRKFVRSSQLKVEKTDRVKRLINICQLFDADEYLTGELAKDYLNEKLFDDAGIKVEYQQYRHPEYPQLYGEFIPYLSVVDLLFNCGPESLKIITSGGK
jgi:hypothetical protein